MWSHATCKGTDYLCPFLSTPAGKDECNNSCHSSSSAILQTPTDESHPGIGEGFQSYDTPVTLSREGREELTWWDNHTFRRNGKSLVKTEIDIVIDSDASLMGWGATSAQQRTGGPWSAKESKMHINCLKLLARSLWMWCLERNIHITAQYLPGIQNAIADAESWTIVDWFDWKLNPNLHQRINHLFGPIEVDLQTDSSVPSLF